MMCASHHSTSGTRSPFASLGTNLASWVAEAIPVLLAEDEMSACSFSSWAFILRRWPSSWKRPGSLNLKERLALAAPLPPTRESKNLDS